MKRKLTIVFTEGTVIVEHDVVYTRCIEGRMLLFIKSNNSRTYYNLKNIDKFVVEDYEQPITSE